LANGGGGVGATVSAALSHVNFNANCAVQSFGLGLQLAADFAIGTAVVSLGAAIVSGGGVVAAGGALLATTLGYDGAIIGRRAIAVGLNFGYAAASGAIATHMAGDPVTSASIKQSLIDAVNPISGTRNAFNAARSACIK